MRVFLDADVLFSAAKSDGAIRKLQDDLLVGSHTLVADPFVIAEARRNLLEKAGPDVVATLETLLTRVEVGVQLTAQTPPHVLLDWLPPKDRPVLGAAIALRCDALVTGDRTHFSAGYGKSFGKVVVYLPVHLAQTLGPSA